MSLPQPGEPAPDFELLDDSGTRVRLSDFRGRRVVLYFYPKDDTPGCTAQACGFRDAFADYRAVDAVILGVSTDSVESHRAFKAKYGLPFPLLADVEHKVSELYGSWGPNTWQGKTFDGIRRNTFVIGEDGRILRVFPGVSPEGHSAEVLQAVRA